jgi:hypothetical protein
MGETPKWASILDVPMQCQKCGNITCAGGCEGDVDGDGSLGCPIEGCGGIAIELYSQLDPHGGKNG